MYVLEETVVDAVRSLFSNYMIESQVCSRGIRPIEDKARMWYRNRYVGETKSSVAREFGITPTAAEAHMRYVDYVVRKHSERFIELVT